MKTSSVIVTFSFSCLLICIAAAGATHHEQVLDTSGKALRPGVKYYILPAILGRGGLTLINPNNTCPLYVVQEKSFYHGKPVTFIPLDEEEYEISTSTYLNIMSIVNPTTSPCDKPLVWSAVKSTTTAPGVWFVVVGDEVDTTFTRDQSIFRIVKSGTDSYVLSLCPVICPGCLITCNKLGLFDQADDGYTHLASNYQLQPYKFRFERA